jgi:hypothetical protein
MNAVTINDLVEDTGDPGWLKVRLVDSGKVGLVPANYVKIEPEETRVSC